METKGNIQQNTDLIKIHDQARILESMLTEYANTHREILDIMVRKVIDDSGVKLELNLTKV